MDTDDLAPCVARSSGTKVLTIQNKWALAFHEEGFQIPTPILGGEMVACEYIFSFPKRNVIHLHKAEEEAISMHAYNSVIIPTPTSQKRVSDKMDVP